MAEKGIRRLVQLILDKASADRLKKDAAEAIDKGTDPAKAKRNLSAVEGAFGRIKKAAVALGGVLATVFAVRKIVDFGKAAVKAATEAEAIWSRLGQAVQNAGASFDKARPGIEAAARALQDATTVGDEDFAAVMTELLTISNDYEGSLRNVSVVADLAAAKQIDLRTAAQLVGRAMVGETGTLSRYGIVVQEGADAIEVLRERFHGFAENEAKTFQGRLTQLSNEWGDFKEAVGNAMIAAGGGTSVLETLTGVVKGMTEWVEKNNEFFEGTAGVLNGVATAAGFLWEALQRLGELMSGFFFGAMSGLVAVASGAAEALALTTSAAARLLDLVGADGSAGRFQSFTDSLRKNAQELRNWAVAAGETSTSSFRNSIFGRSGAQPGASGGRGGGGYSSSSTPRTGGTGPGGGAGAPSLPDVGVKGMDFIRFPTPTLDPTPFTGGLETMQNAAWETEEEVSEAVRSMSEAFTNGFAAVFEGSKSLSEAAIGIGAAMVEDLTEGQPEYHAAQAIAKLAEGLWPPNPAALASSAKHALAAAAFAAVRGIARAGARGGGRGGSGSRGLSGGAAGRLGSARPLQAAGPEVHIYFDGPGFSAVNPQVQRIVYNAQRNAQELYGPNAAVKTHGRG